MPSLPIVFRQLLAAIDRPAFERRVAQTRAEAYDKSFGAWDHRTRPVKAAPGGIARSTEA